DGGLLTMSGQLSYQQREKIKVILRGEYFRYKLENEAYAWNIPDLKVTLSGIYDLYDKIIVRADVFFVGQRYGRSLVVVDGGEQLEGQNIWAYRLKPFVDANLGVEYRYTKRISAFLNVNNIAASRYQYWYKYPVQSINVMGGFTVSF
ncbi:MAG TPA: TonB-dependent receptor, partial [Flavobacteriales bacterium]|nr:TonB-dependent receptor [Flavobacteriales bacterium]